MVKPESEPHNNTKDKCYKSCNEPTVSRENDNKSPKTDTPSDKNRNISNKSLKIDTPSNDENRGSSKRFLTVTKENDVSEIQKKSSCSKLEMDVDASSIDKIARVGANISSNKNSFSRTQSGTGGNSLMVLSHERLEDKKIAPNKDSPDSFTFAKEKLPYRDKSSLIMTATPLPDPKSLSHQNNIIAAFIIIEKPEKVGSFVKSKPFSKVTNFLNAITDSPKLFEEAPKKKSVDTNPFK